MSKQDRPSRLKYVQLVNLLKVPKSITANRESVLKFFKETTDLVAPKRGKRRLAVTTMMDSSVRLAGEPNSILLAAYEGGHLRWEQLATILRESIQYIQIYWNQVHRGWQPKPVEVGDEAFYTEAALKSRQDDYVRRIAFLADIHMARDSKGNLSQWPRFKAGSQLQGKQLRYWVRGAPHTGKRTSGKALLAWAYKCELESDDFFQTDYTRIKGIIAGKIDEALASQGNRSLRSWMYVADTDSLFIRTFGEVLYRSFDTPKEIECRCRQLLNEFCRGWCIDMINVDRESADGEPKAHFSPRRIVVSTAEDGSGLNIFIPRYYKFSDVHHYRNADFREVRESLNEVFESVRKKRPKIGLATRRKDARKLIAENLAFGLPKYLAWLEAADAMPWSHETMRTNVTSCPLLPFQKKLAGIQDKAGHLRGQLEKDARLLYDFHIRNQKLSPRDALHRTASRMENCYHGLAAADFAAALARIRPT